MTHCALDFSSNLKTNVVKSLNWAVESDVCELENSTISHTVLHTAKVVEKTSDSAKQSELANNTVRAGHYPSDISSAKINLFKNAPN